jgi:hypothetical protein
MVFWDQGERVTTAWFGSLTSSYSQAFLLYTVDKIVASLIKQVRWSLLERRPNQIHVLSFL